MTEAQISCFTVHGVGVCTFSVAGGVSRIFFRWGARGLAGGKNLDFDSFVYVIGRGLSLRTTTL